jgi:hypothetical protein
MHIFRRERSITTRFLSIFFDTLPYFGCAKYSTMYVCRAVSRPLLFAYSYLFSSAVGRPLVTPSQLKTKESRILEHA